MGGEEAEREERACRRSGGGNTAWFVLFFCQVQTITYSYLVRIKCDSKKWARNLNLKKLRSVVVQISGQFVPQCGSTDSETIITPFISGS